MNRRDFLKASALIAGAFAVDTTTFAARVSQMGAPRLTMGVLSDIHIRTEEDIPVFEKTLRYFRDRKVDGVIIAGDMADTGLERQMKLIADTWFRVFPKDRLPGGHHVERLFIYGNHDMEGFNYSSCTAFIPKDQRKDVIAREAIVNKRAAYWQKYWHETFKPVYIKTVKGYKFVGAHWEDWKGNHSVPAFLEAHRRELQGSKPFFYFQHPHPKDTCGGPWAWGQDDGASTEALGKFPNCIAFSGHSHTILNDERTIWQGAFTSVGTSSLSYTYSLGGRENTYVDGETNKKMPYQMRPVNQHDGKQGMVMTVYDDNITLERHEFVYDESVGDNWIIPLPSPGDRTLSFEYRAERARVPQFLKGDKVTATRAKGKDRYGVEQMQTTAHFPNVLKKRNGVRAFDFEVGLELHDQDVYRMACTKHVMSPHFYLGENKDGGEVTCVFGENEAPAGRKARFHVRPCNCFGRKGNEIVSEWFDLK